MKQFIPFEDDWDVLEGLRPDDLIPYQVGLLRFLGSMPCAQVPAFGNASTNAQAVPPPAPAS